MMRLLALCYGLLGVTFVQYSACAGQTLLFDNNDSPSDATDVRRVEEGDSIVLDCEAGGSPSPTIHWLFNKQRIAVGSANSIFDDEAYYEHTSHNDNMVTLGIGSTKSKLFIDCAGKRHDGIYMCVADTQTERITKKFRVEVESRKTSEPVSCTKENNGKGDSKARVYMWTAQRLEVENADVQLYCRVEGLPTPRVLWLDTNGKPIEADTTGQYELLQNGDLLIKRITFENNMGMYRCVAENQYGRDEIGAFLYPTTMD